MSDTTIFWDAHGNATELPTFPDSFEKIMAGDALYEHYRPILAAVETALSLKIIGIDIRSANTNLILDVEYEDGRHDIIRTPNPDIPDDERDPDAASRIVQEGELLRWLRANSTLPVPAICAVIHDSGPEGRSIVVMEKVTGRMVLNCIGRALPSVKERLLHAFAGFQIKMFRLDVPQRIGTARCTEGKLEVVPSSDAPETGYDSLEEYVYSILESKERALLECTDADARTRGTQVLSRIRRELRLILARISEPSYRRCVLKHDDLAPLNMLMNESGDLTGVIDWDYQSVLPAVLAVEYPSFIQYGGVLDPVYAVELGEGMETWWFVSPHDAKLLKDHYTEIAKAKDPEYHAALVDGEILHHTIDWLCSGRDYAVIEGWMNTVFSPS